MANSLVERYSNEIASTMNKKLNYDLVIGIPKIDKIILNMGVGDAVFNAENLNETVEELTLISGQEPLIIKAKKSITNFRLCGGMSTGAKVTLRGDKMYDFLYKLVNTSLPRIHDFRGINSRPFDGHGSYTLGIKEQLISPEIGYNKVSHAGGLDVVIVATANTDEEARELLTELGMPFVK